MHVLKHFPKNSDGRRTKQLTNMKPMAGRVDSMVTMVIVKNVVLSSAYLSAKGLNQMPPPLEMVEHTLVERMSSDITVIHILSV